MSDDTGAILDIRSMLVEILQELKIINGKIQ